MTFRDYTSPATADSRFIPVRSDDQRIQTALSCAGLRPTASGGPRGMVQIVARSP
jgi:hypothetical protein